MAEAWQEDLALALQEIRADLRVLVYGKRQELLKEIKKKSPSRQKMFVLFTGTKTATEIGEELNVKRQSVEEFIEDCRSKGLVEYVRRKDGRRCPQRIG